MDSPTHSIIIVSNEPWSKVWFSKQHYANELTQMGHPVYFLNPPSNWGPKNLIKPEINISPTEEGINIVQYGNPFPIRIFPKIFRYLNDLINSFKILSKIPGQRIIFWQFDPNRFGYFPKAINRIYHVSDPYIHIPLDKVITQRAQLVVCTSPKYIPYYSDRHNHVIYIPHGISEEEGQVDLEAVETIRQKYGKFVLLIGSLNETVDYNLLMTVVESGHTLVIAGAVNVKSKEKLTIWEEICSFSNAVHLGVIHAKTIKNYVQASSTCITAYQFDLTKSVGQGSPLKILNYLSQYRPVITTIDSEIDELEGKGIYRAYSKQEFLDYLQKGMAGELHVDEEKVGNYLSKHKYPQLIKKILSHLPQKANT